MTRRSFLKNAAVGVGGLLASVFVAKGKSDATTCPCGHASVSGKHLHGWFFDALGVRCSSCGRPSTSQLIERRKDGYVWHASQWGTPGSSMTQTTVDQVSLWIECGTRPPDYPCGFKSSDLVTRAYLSVIYV